MEELENEHEDSFFEEFFWIFMGIGGFLLVISILIEFLTELVLLSQFLAFSSIFFSSYGISKEAFEDVKNKRITANLLMIIAAVASFFIMHGQEGATAIILFAIAERIEELTTEKSRDAIRDLLELAPDTALLKESDGYKEVEVEQIKKGDIIGVKPGMKVPLDGAIVKGNSYFDESAITGESIPVYKEEGDEIFAGGINSNSFIDVKVEKESSETLVAKIAKTIQEAQLNKSKSERFIEKFARYYTPIILISAIFVMIVPPLLFGFNFNDWFYRGLILLVVSCPCALTLSTPLAMISSLSKLAKEGILVKGNKFIEKMKDIELFAFDKTGTLTEGRLKLFDIIPKETSEKEILAIAASLERLSEHPISKAIVFEAEKKDINFREVNSFNVVKGKGIEGIINNNQYHVGSIRFFNDLDYDLPEKELEILERKGTLPILVGNGKVLLGILTIRDVMRISAPILSQGLEERGYKTVLISGDSQAACKTIGECLNISSIHGELLPNQKLEKIEQLKKQYKGVSMVGDGINDAPSMALSDLGIAIGASATDLTLETADVVIMNDDLKNILTLVDIAEKTNRKIRQNIWASILIKVSFAILTVLGLMTLWIAVGIGDLGVSFAVLLNGLALFRYKSKFQDIETEEITSNAKLIICDNCKTKQPIPQHHGRDMIKEGEKLVCWRRLIETDTLENCEQEISLFCPQCQEKLQIH
ncbi:MAG: putative cadmium-transporting ATPase [Promethearchaeota archaeon]|nr:MAG: putative cadmium-transporting ATPase [Candidatus Lokiarchaeota archaeon]